MSRRIAVRAARLFDGADSSPDPLVLVEDGRIVDVGHGAAPPGWEVLDLGGATLLPGLVDTHVHLAFDGGPDPIGSLAQRDGDALTAAMAEAAAAQLRAGVTTVRDLGDRDFSVLGLRGSGAGPLPTIVAAGPPLTSVGGHCHFLGGEVVPAGIRAAVRAHVERGVDVIKVMASGGMMTAGSDFHAPQFSAGELAVVVDEAHRHGLPVTAHAHALAAVRDAVAAGVDGIEHCSFLGPEGVVVPDALVEAIVARRIAIGSTVGLAPCARDFVPPPQLAALLPHLLAAHARLVDKGAVVVAGTDAGIAPPKPHGVLPHGLAELAGLGMSTAAALRAGTQVAAQVCGLGHRKGRIATGYDADLLAVDGDPLADLAALLRPVAVLLRGEPLPTPETVR
ncbi:amidohydrolase family protein [Pseudonocardia sp.]|uniref:amidohydrolase family protein n=1 Tax=Pseudonocardia sp. TaxID=60912 RepID=UPI0026144410|nr:amidohydrolase family protein [Pseudonocardia sp.]